QGEAPISAANFLELLTKHSQINPFVFSVVGFGSTSYPKFCQFAYQVHDALEGLKIAEATAPVFTVNDRSFEAFSSWASTWGTKEEVNLQLDKSAINLPKKQHRSEERRVGKEDKNREKR